MSRLIILLFVVLLCPRAVADVNIQSMVLTLEVPDGREPEFVCVLTQNRCARGGCLSKPLASFYSAVIDTSPAVTADAADQDTFKFLSELDASKDLGEGDIREAANALAHRTYVTSCDVENRDACRAQIRLDQFHYTPGSDKRNPTPTVGSISCVRQRAARGPNPTSNLARVAFISLHVGAEAIPAAAVSELHLYGTTLSVDFEKPLPASTSASAQVIGGDYAFKDVGTGTVRHLATPLIPRCGHTVVALPPHLTSVSSISVGDHPTCESPHDPTTWNASSRRVELEIPTSLTDSIKKLKIRYKPEEDEAVSVGTNESEAEWTDSVAPKVLTPGQRVIRFSWKRPSDCLRDEWKGDVAPKQGRWNGNCPQATLASNTKCNLVYPYPNDVKERCDYVCTVSDDRDPLMLPVEVRFERIRLRRNPSRENDKNKKEPDASTDADEKKENEQRKDASEIVYSWTDHLSSLGQELTSIVPPEDRRLFIELDPEKWKPRFGDQFDAIRVIVGQAQEQIDLTGDSSGNLHSWFAMSTPGRTCSDRTRLAIFGTRKYKETTRNLESSQLRLAEPSSFRDKWQGYLVAGAAVMYRDFPLTGTPVGHIGIGAQLDLSWFSPKLGSLSANVDAASLELARQFYKGVELPFGSRSEYLSVPYLRIDLAHVGLEWWFWKRLGVGALGGPGLGTPVYFEDDRRVGAIRWSFSWKAYGLYTLARRRVWLLFGTGLRHFEEHADFGTDFLGEPTRELTHPNQLQFFAHFRWMMP